jgi:hypothetical protein
LGDRFPGYPTDRGGLGGRSAQQMNL